MRFSVHTVHVYNPTYKVYGIFHGMRVQYTAKIYQHGIPYMVYGVYSGNHKGVCYFFNDSIYCFLLVFILNINCLLLPVRWVL